MKVLPAWLENLQSNETDKKIRKRNVKVEDDAHNISTSSGENVSVNHSPRKGLAAKHDVSDEEMEEECSKPVQTSSPVKCVSKHNVSEEEMGEGSSKPVQSISPGKLVSKHDISDEEMEDDLCVKPSNSLKKPKHDDILKEFNCISELNIDKSLDQNNKVNEAATSSNHNEKENDSSSSNKNPTENDSSKPILRQSCPFGAGCYRKNPLHFQAMAHPDDPDYEEDADTADDDGKPECEYGVKCYRKNPQHKRDYKHARKPQPKRKRKANAQNNADNDTDDDYDYEDPFIDDASSEEYLPTSDTDSDFDPDDTEQDKKETKRAKKEAKKFLRKN